MVMHARKIRRLNDGYFERNQAHPYENSGGKYSKNQFGDLNDKSPALDGPGLVMESPDRRPSPRYPHKASYTQRLKERDHHHSEAKSPMSKERNNRSHSSSHHHSSGGGSSSQNQHSSSSSSNMSNNRSKSSENSTSRSNHDRSHANEEPEKERRSQQSSCDWSEHVSSSGKKYYYNCRTEVSQWEKPKEMLEWEKQHSKTAPVEVPQPQQQQQSSRNRDKNSSSTNRSSDRHSSSSGSRSHATRDRDFHHSSSNRSSNNNDQQGGSSGSSSSSNSSNSSSISSGAAPHHSKTSTQQRATEEESRTDSNRLTETPTRGGGGVNHYHHQQQQRRSSSRKDSAQDMEISPDSSCVADSAHTPNVVGRETPRSHHSQQQLHPQSQATPTNHCRTPKTEASYANSHHHLHQGVAAAASMTPIIASAAAQLLSPSQVTLANLPRLISQLAGTQGLPNLSELSQQEALQTIQQALQLTKQLGGMNRSPHGSSISAEAKALALSPAIISAALRGETGSFYPLPGTTDSRRSDCISPSSECHSHSSRQTSPASSPASVGIPINNGTANVTTSVAAAIAAANSAGCSVSSLKPSTPSLTPSLSNYFREDLVSHVTGWQADHAERQSCRYSEEAHNMGSLNCTRVSAELKMARSLVRLAEIQATLQEQRILFLRQQVKELEDRRSQNSFMMDT